MNNRPRDDFSRLSQTSQENVRSTHWKRGDGAGTIEWSRVTEILEGVKY